MTAKEVPKLGLDVSTNDICTWDVADEGVRLMHQTTMAMQMLHAWRLRELKYQEGPVNKPLKQALRSAD